MSKKKYKGKYRIESARKKDYDYASNGAYFITIVTKNRNHYFGTIRDVAHKVSYRNDSIMQLSQIGEFAKKYWFEIPLHFPFITLDEMVIMPNHVHAIVWINKKNIDAVGGNVVDAVGGNDADAVDGRDVACNVSTTGNKTKNLKMANISPKQGTLSTVIRSFKSVVTKNSRIIDKSFAWQTRFHDRIIRDENELNSIRNYIQKNPMIWQRDQNNKNKL